MARTLIVRYSQIGDVLIFLPILYSLAKQYPEDEFTVLTNPKFSDLFKRMPSNISLYPMIYRKQNIPLRGLVYIFQRYKLLMSLFLSKKYDQIALLQEGTFDSQLGNLSRMRGSKVAKIDMSVFLSKERLHREDDLSLFKMYLDVMSQLGYNKLKPEFSDTQYTNTERQEQVLKSVGLNTNDILIGIAPFSRLKAKMYPLEKIEKVIAYFQNKSNIRLIILGGGHEEKLKAEEWEKTYTKTSSMVNKLSFEEEITLISACKTIVSMDSANMHLASLVNVPVVSIWGPSSPRLGFYPINQKEENAIQKELKCRPCSFWGENPCTNTIVYECMDIDPQTIINKINSII